VLSPLRTRFALNAKIKISLDDRPWIARNGGLTIHASLCGATNLTTHNREEAEAHFTEFNWWVQIEVQFGSTRSLVLKNIGFIPFNPSVFFDQMKVHGGIHPSLLPKSEGSETAFATPPLRPDAEFNSRHVHILTQRKRGADYINSRVANGPWPLTPTALRVIEKKEKGTQSLTSILSGQLSNELLHATAAAAAA
jgi:hypothetical protein